jgi:hypothetical protein
MTMWINKFGIVIMTGGYSVAYPPDTLMGGTPLRIPPLLGHSDRLKRGVNPLCKVYIIFLENSTPLIIFVPKLKIKFLENFYIYIV